MLVSEQLTMDAPIETVYDLFVDLDRWPEVIPEIAHVDVHYMDGYNQEFSMTMQWRGRQETVRGVLFCRAPYELELVRITPPSGLSRMTGRWALAEENGRTTVTVSRDFRLLNDDAPREDDEESTAAMIRSLLRHGLELFRETAERARQQ
jgi:polyketide cyclase/dehydrase/lipid transport protein